MNFLSASLFDRITKQVRNQLLRILLKEVSNFALPVIEMMITKSLNQVNLAKASSQPQSTYEAASTLTEFELKKILIDKMNSSESYLIALEHRECYNGLIKSYNIDKDFFSFYDVYSLKRSRQDKDKDEGPCAGSDRGLKKRKTSKDAEPTTSMKNKDSSSMSSKGTKSQPKSSSKSVHAEEPEFEVRNTNTPQGQEGNPDKTPQKGPTQNWFMTLATSTSTDKLLNEFDELMSTPIDFSSYILNGLKIENLTQEILLGPAFRLLKGTRSNYAKLEYDFEECYKALSKKLDWDNPKDDDYLFDLFKQLPLITHGNHQSIPVEFFINNDLKYLQGGISTMTYTASTTKTKAAQYNLPGIEDMVSNIWSSVKLLMINMHYVGFHTGEHNRNRLMHSDELYNFSDGTLTRLLSLLEDITKNIDMEYFPKRRWSKLEKKRAHFMIKDINKLLKERRMMRSLEKFVSGRFYRPYVRLLQRTI
nr:hypothetical protein [Tanacetum cinerariifolium]